MTSAKQNEVKSMKKEKKHHLTEMFRHTGSRFSVTPFDPEKQVAVIRSSICTGEKVAGFKSREDGSFTEIMLIRSPKDVQTFKETYGVETLKTEY